MAKDISKAVIRRLPRYFRYLGELMEEGVERISSKDLSERMHVTASQIRQDLNNFGGFGQQGYGYNVEFLYEEIGKILGLTRRHPMVVIGAGHLGQAIANYVKFEKLGFLIIGLFDVDPEVVGSKVRGIPVLPVTDLQTFLETHEVEIAALTMPKDAAESVVSTLTGNGIRAIWNFAHVDLDVDDMVVENVHLSDSLMELSYRILQSE